MASFALPVERVARGVDSIRSSVLPALELTASAVSPSSLRASQSTPFGLFPSKGTLQSSAAPRSAGLQACRGRRAALKGCATFNSASGFRPYATPYTGSSLRLPGTCPLAAVHERCAPVDRSGHRRQHGDLHLVDEVLLRRLPVKDPEQLVLFNGARNHYGSNSGGNMLSYPMYEDFRDNFVDRGTASRLAARQPAGRRRRASDARLQWDVRAPDGGDERRRRTARPSACRASWSPALISRCLASAPRSAASSRRTTTGSAAEARWRC